MAGEEQKGPIITPNGIPQNQEAPGGPGFPQGQNINWEPPTVPNRPATDPVGGVGSGNEWPQPSSNTNNQNQ